MPEPCHREVPEVPTVRVSRLIEAYGGLLFDAYGVLVDKSGALPGAPELIARLNHCGKPYLVLTNSASRLPDALALDFAGLGLAVSPERFLTSGMLLERHFDEAGLRGCRCMVLGPEDARRYVERAGGHPLGPREEGEVEVVVVADQKGFDCLQGMNRVLNLAIRRLDAGLPLHLVLCNPDLVYPVAPGRYGLTSGALAVMLEAALAERYPGARHRFARLGKPHAAMFEEAERRLGTRCLIMIGDQLATDILGARNFGVDSALVRTGLAPRGTEIAEAMSPSYRLDGLGD